MRTENQAIYKWHKDQASVPIGSVSSMLYHTEHYANIHSKLFQTITVHCRDHMVFESNRDVSSVQLECMADGTFNTTNLDAMGPCVSSITSN